METYYAGINKVFVYIDDHLAEDLSLPALSQVSGYSPYHFHRIFHAVTGRTPHEYVLDRKVHNAASRLLYERSSITQIALDSGFSSSGSFTRCFQKAMRCSPSYYRKNRSRKRPIRPADIRAKAYRRKPAFESLFSIVALTDIDAAGIVTEGLSPDFQSKAIEASFEKLFRWIVQSGLDAAREDVMGVTLDTPEVVPLSECRYFACVAVHGNIEPEGEIFVRTLRLKGDFIRFSLIRSRPDFAEIFFQITDYLYGCYMPRAGCYPDNRSFIEIYRQSGADVEVCFHVPVRWQESI